MLAMKQMFEDRLTDEIYNTVSRVEQSKKHKLTDEYVIKMDQHIKKSTNVFSDLMFFLMSRKFSTSERTTIQSWLVPIIAGYQQLMSLYSYSRAQAQCNELELRIQTLVMYCKHGAIVNSKKRKVVTSLCNKLEAVLRYAREFVDLQKRIVSADKSTTTE